MGRNDWAPTYPGGWHNKPSTLTPFNATVGNNWDAGVENAAAMIDTHTGPPVVVFSRQLTGDAFPWIVIYSDKTLRIGDGTVDLTALSGTDGAALIVQGMPNQSTMQVRAANDSSVHTVGEWTDHLGALIMWLSNVGGLSINDSLQLVQSVFGPTWFYADIYGYMQQRGHACFRHPGPPGNALDHATACGSVFNGTRAASFGTWQTAFGASTITAITSPYTGLTNPGESFHVIRLQQATGSNMLAFTGTSTALCVPCVPGNYVKGIVSMRAAVSTRTITPSMLFVDNTGTVIGGTITGSTGSMTAGAWVNLAVGGVAPASAAGCALQVGGPSFAAAEICYLTGAGIWVDTRTSSAADANPTSVWSPPYTGQNDGTAWEAASGGDEYIRTDDVATSGHRIYMLDAAAGFWLPRQIGAPGSTAQPRWVSVA